MRKSIIDANAISGSKPPVQNDAWLDLDQLATVEITSEDPEQTIENALGNATTSGWRASSKGPQFIRIKFDNPTRIRRIWLHFVDRDSDRSQEFSIHAKSADGTIREIVRQQFTFTPRGSTEETEDFSVDLADVICLELHIDPDRAHDPAHSQSFAVLQSLRIA